MISSAVRTAATRVRKMDRQQAETIFTSSAFMITAGLTFVNTILLSRALGDDGRGAVAAAFGNTLVLGWAFQIGVPNAAAYFAKDIERRRVAMSSWAMTMFYAVPIAIALIPFYLWQMRGDTFDEFGPGLKAWYVAFIILNLFNGPFLTGVFWLRGIGNTVKFNALLALPQLLITAGYAVLFVLDELTVFSALTSTFVMMVIGWTIGLVSAKALPGRGFSIKAFREVRHFAVRSWAGNLAFFVSLRIDQMLLVGVVAPEQLGVYAVAAAFSTLSGPIARGVAQGMLPFVRKAASDDERLRRVQQSSVWVTMASVGTLAVIAVTAGVALPFLLGDKFEAAVEPLLLLLPGAFATDVNQVYSTALQSFNRPEDASKAQLASAVTTGVGLALLIGPYGINGAAVTTSISYWVALLVTYFYWRRLKGQVRRGEATGHTEAMANRDDEPVIATDPA